jgi:hypothetical protein
MKGTLGSILIAAGTVVAALGAAKSAKAGRDVVLADLGAEQLEYLLRDVERDGTALANAGARLDGELVATLRAAGVETVEVRVPPVDRETLPRDAAELVGRVLADDVRLAPAEAELPAGRVVTTDLLERLAAAEVLEVQVETADEASVTLSTATAEEGIPDGARLAADVRFLESDVKRAGIFVDEPLAERIAQGPAESIAVRITPEFSLAGWEGRNGFLLGLVLMLLGITLRRIERRDAALLLAAGGGADAGPTGPDLFRAALQQLLDETERLAARSAEMDGAEVTAAVDPLLNGPVLELIDRRQVVADAYGVAVQAEVLSLFASGERRLNRAWSAGVDGYDEEAGSSLRSAVAPLREALAALPG